MVNKKSKKADISSIKSQVESNSKLMKAQRKYLTYFITFTFIVAIIVLFYNNFSDSRTSPSFIVFIIMIILLVIMGYFLYKIRKWALEKNIRTIEKMQERLKSGEKFSKRKAKLVSALLISSFLIFGLAILGIGIHAMFNQPGKTTTVGAVKISLFGTGITALGVYALILYIRNHHLLNNPKYYY